MVQNRTQLAFLFTISASGIEYHFKMFFLVLRAVCTLNHSLLLSCIHSDLNCVRFNLFYTHLFILCVLLFTRWCFLLSSLLTKTTNTYSKRRPSGKRIKRKYGRGITLNYRCFVPLLMFLVAGRRHERMLIQKYTCQYSMSYWYCFGCRNPWYNKKKITFYDFNYLRFYIPWCEFERIPVWVSQSSLNEVWVVIPQ